MLDWRPVNDARVELQCFEKYYYCCIQLLHPTPASLGVPHRRGMLHWPYSPELINLLVIVCALAVSQRVR